MGNSGHHFILGAQFPIEYLGHVVFIQHEVYVEANSCSGTLPIPEDSYSPGHQAELQTGRWSLSGEQSDHTGSPKLLIGELNS